MKQTYTKPNQAKPNQIGPELGTAQPQLVLYLLTPSNTIMVALLIQEAFDQMMSSGTFVDLRTIFYFHKCVGGL